MKPECADGKLFCQYVTNYPQQEMYNALKSANYSIKNFDRKNDTLVSRWWSDIDRYVCASNTYLIMPQVAYNTKKEPQYIFNFENYQQTVTISECVR